MRAIMDGATKDPTLGIVEAVKDCLAELNAYEINELTDDLQLAETIGRLKCLIGILVSIVGT